MEDVKIMTLERAIEILDPKHREHYDSIETVNEACRMGMAALKKRIPVRAVRFNKAKNSYMCPICGFEYSLNSHGLKLEPGDRVIRFCMMCGQTLNFDA